MVNQPRIKVNVRIQLPLNEVLVFERNLLKLERDVEFWVASRYFEHFVGELLNDFCTRIVVLVHTMPKAHQATVSRFHALDEFPYLILCADFVEHVQHLLVRAAVQRTIQRRRRSRHCRVRINMRTADTTHRVRTAILLVIGVQDEQNIERLHQRRVRLVLWFRHAPQHAHEIRDVAQ